MEAALSELPIDSKEPNDPTLTTDAQEPTLPIDSTDPSEAIDRMLS